MIDNELFALFVAMSALEQKWLIRIVLRRVAVGLGGRTVLGALDPAANDVYARTTHLSHVCAHLQRTANPPAATAMAVAVAGVAAAVGAAEQPPLEVHVRPGQPFQPQLCDRVRMRTLDQMLSGPWQYYAETKLDGERFQVLPTSRA